MTSCVRCGNDLGIGRFCLNCGHPVGEPAPAPERRSVVDAAQPQAARARRSSSWLPWAIGAGLLVLIGVLLLVASLLADDEPTAKGVDRPTGQTASEEESPADEETPAIRPVDLTRSVQVVAPPAAPPTTDLDGTLVSYGPRRMLDGDPATAWRTTGDATGQTVSFSLPSATTVRRVGLINGYAKQVDSDTGIVDWYPNNRRITAVEWVFDDGTVVPQDLVEKPKLQRLTIEPETTTSIQLRVLSVTAPGAGPLGRDYTVVSEVLIAGTPAA